MTLEDDVKLILQELSTVEADEVTLKAIDQVKDKTIAMLQAQIAALGGTVDFTEINNRLAALHANLVADEGSTTDPVTPTPVTPTPVTPTPVSGPVATGPVADPTLVVKPISIARLVPQSSNLPALGLNPDFGTYRMMGPDWGPNKPLTGLAVDDSSAAIIAMSGAIKLYADCTIPVVVTDSSQETCVRISYDEYATESDDCPAPIKNAVVEGGSYDAGNDQHLIIYDRNLEFLSETWNTRKKADGTLVAACGAIFNAQSGSTRKFGKTSGDAAGLPIAPFIIGYDEAIRGEILHAGRFTFNNSISACVLPATHYSGTVGSKYPGMGQAFRMIAGTDKTGFSKLKLGIYNMLETYGLRVADNGGTGRIQFTSDPRWSNVIDELNSILNSLRISQFEVVNVGPLLSDSNVPIGDAPEIQSFTATRSVDGTTVVLDMQCVRHTYAFIKEIGPWVGAVTIPYVQGQVFSLVASNLIGDVTQLVQVD